jgi:hypothetical protein
MARSSGQTSVSKSHLTDSVVGDNASLTRVGGNYEVHNHYGATVGVPLRPRDPPRHWLPSTHDPCLGRDEILQSIWQEAHGVELNGPLGIGRTNLTRHTAHAAKDDWEAVYYTDRAEAVGEILRGILSCFYEWDEGAIPSDHSVAERLREHRPLVVLDNDALRRDSVEQVANLLGPGSFVIYSSITRQLAAGATVMLLPGLDPDSAIHLAELRLRRTVDEKEREALRQFAVAVDGHPFNFISAVLGVGRSRITLDALTTEGQRQPDLGDDDRYVLEILRCLDGAAIPVEELEALCESRGISASAVIDRLDRAGLIERHSPRVSIREEPGAHPSTRSSFAMSCGTSPLQPSAPGAGVRGGSRRRCAGCSPSCGGGSRARRAIRSLTPRRRSWAACALAPRAGRGRRSTRPRWP